MKTFRGVLIGAAFTFALLIYCSTDDAGGPSDDRGDTSDDPLDVEVGADIAAQDTGDGSDDLDALSDRVDTLEAALVALHECPADMIKVSDFCIEIDERPAEKWGFAAAECLADGRRLCASEEIFPFGVNRDEMRDLASNLNDYTNNWEWTADLVQQHDPPAVRARATTVDGTSAASSHETTEELNYRCCLSVLP